MQYILNTDSCPVIKAGTKVKVLHTFNFPATKSRFVTIQDLENQTLNRFNQLEPIISTIRLVEGYLHEAS